MELLLYVFFAASGAIAASFAGVVSERVHTGQSWRSGRSKCNSCRTTLAMRDLIPVLSWVTSGGRCRSCGSRIPVTYLIIEGALGLAFTLAYAKLGLGLPLLTMLIALVVLTFIVLYDLRHTIVPPIASLLLVLVSLGFALLSHPDSRFFGLSLFIAGCISLFIFLLHALSRGRAMGLGDAPVAFSLALLVGASHAPTGLLFSFWVGALFGIALLLRRPGGPTMGIEVPFVPFLAAGFLLAYFTQWNPFPLFVL